MQESLKRQTLEEELRVVRERAASMDNELQQREQALRDVHAQLRAHEQDAATLAAVQATNKELRYEPAGLMRDVWTRYLMPACC